MLNLGSIMGTRMRLDFSFIILVAFFVIISMENAAGFHIALLWAPILFFSVLAHELGHAAAYGILGMGPSVVILGQMGGLTYNDSPREPWQQFVVSVAGPLLSFVLAAISWGLYKTIPSLQADPMMSLMLPQMTWANIFWGIFNLAPVVPLDGGIALWSVAQGATTPERAYLFSAWSSIAFSAGGLILALMTGQIFIAAFAGFFIFSNYKRLKALNEPPPPSDPEDGGPVDGGQA